MVVRVLRPPFAYYGGKSKYTKILLQYVPPHKTYVEVFGGAASLLLAKEPSEVEIYNDIDEGVVNFFRVLRDDEQRARLVKLLDYTPNSRAEYRHCLQTWKSVDDPVERARRWFVVIQLSTGGRFGAGWGYNVINNARVKAFRSSVAMLDAAAGRFRHVQVECNDFRKVLRAYDTPETFFYNDPPYVHDTRSPYFYPNEMSLDDHRELVELLLGLKGMALLSGYRHEVYFPLEEAGWQLVTFPVKMCAALTPGERGRERVECLWISPSAISRLQKEQPGNQGRTQTRS